jgi:signal transduction histidine kinase
MLPIICIGQPTNNIAAVKDKINLLFKASRFDSAIRLLQNEINKPQANAEEKFQYYMELSDIYKRYYDYNNTAKYLDIAATFIPESMDPAKNRVHNYCGKLFVAFDMVKYDSAAYWINKIEAEKNLKLEPGDECKINIIKGFLSFLKKDYNKAKYYYNNALAITQNEDQCDRPLIYGKMIVLALTLNDEKSAKEYYIAGNKIADSCNIPKYNIYLNGTMKNGYIKIKNYKKAIEYFTIQDSLERKYNENNYLGKILDINTKYETDKKEALIQIQKQKLVSDSFKISTLVLLLLAGIAATFAYIISIKRKQLLQDKAKQLLYNKRSLQTIEEERSRIAIELHDSINHDLLALKNNYKTHGKLESNEVDDVINNVRNISKEIYPVTLDKLGLVLAVEQLCDKLLNDDLFISTEINYPIKFTKETELHIFRIIQEALNNVVKYANAKGAKVIIKPIPVNYLQVIIVDNGNGFNVDDKINNSTSLGIFGMQQRALAIGGQLDIESNKNGTKISLAIAYEENNSN